MASEFAGLMKYENGVHAKQMCWYALILINHDTNLGGVKSSKSKRARQKAPCFTRVALDEGVDVNARPGAPRVKHHGVEDAAVVGRPAEAREDAREVRERAPELGQVRARRSEKGQREKQNARLHLPSAG